MKMNCSKPLLLFYFAVIHLVTPTAAQYCYDTGNYTSNSTYRANLNTLLASMYSNTEIDYGFYNFSAGESPNKVNAIDSAEETFRPMYAVLVSMSQVAPYRSLVQTRSRQ